MTAATARRRVRGRRGTGARGAVVASAHAAGDRRVRRRHRCSGSSSLRPRPARRVIPPPSAIWTRCCVVTGGPWPIGTAALATVYEALGGLVIGTVAGVAVAFADGALG